MISKPRSTSISTIRGMPEGNSNFKYQNMEMSVWEIGIERKCLLESECDRWSMMKTAIGC